MPSDVVGRSCAAATAELERLGLAASCTETFTPDRDDDGVVLWADPPAGGKADRNTSVTLTVGRCRPSQSSEDPAAGDHTREHGRHRRQ
ncbi:PASTA domain-containing protein [Streptomyces sp. NPDC001288]